MCLALWHPNVYLQAKICSYPSSSSSFSLVLHCVYIFVVDEFFVWATILRTCLALHWGAQIADVPCVCDADVCWGAQLADMPCIAFGRPTCGCVNVPCICVADVCWGAQLAELPCIALGRPTSRRALRCVRAHNLPTCLVLRLGAHLADALFVGLGRPTLVRPY